MTINDLTVSIRHLARETLLEDWVWLIGRDRLPVMATLAGDVFVQDQRTGAVHFVDTVEGTCMEVAHDGEEFGELLKDKAFVMQHFSVNLVAPLIKADSMPGPGQLLSFKKPPVLGGEYATSNLEPADIAGGVGAHTSSQINDTQEYTQGFCVGCSSFDCLCGILPSLRRYTVAA